MLEDKLSREERIRLECIAQANAGSFGRTVGNVIDTAKEFEAYIKGMK